MATLQKKKTNGIYYWYIVESVRVNGKPRPKVLAYLGKAENLLEKLKGKTPLSSKSYEYGPAAVVDKIINKIGIIDIINSKILVDKKEPMVVRNNLNLGQTLALIMHQRALCPDSKRAFHLWAKRTFLPFMYEFDPENADSQHFWDMMDLVPEEAIPALELEITKRIVNLFNIKPDLLLYDYTNFFTFIDTLNTKNTIAQRGKNKQKRNDLRQFCLALLVTRATKIPLFSDIYEGNKNDVREFSDSIGRLRTRLEKLSLSFDDITLVFDKGNNSKNNFKKLDDLNYVASLSVHHHKELKEIPFSKLEPMVLRKDKNNKEVILNALRVDDIAVWGIRRTAVIYFSQALYDGQIRGINRALREVKEKLEDLKESCPASGGACGEGKLTSKSKPKKWTKELLEREVETIINRQFIRDIVDFKIKKSNSGFTFTYEISESKFNQLKSTVLGKRILITNRHDWSTQEIILAYQGQSDVEFAFRQIKNPFHCCVRPQFHWTDQKIKVHTFSCVLAYTISALIEKTARDNGFNYTIDEIFERLLEIRKVRYISPARGGISPNVSKKYNIEWQLEQIEDKNTEALFKVLMG